MSSKAERRSGSSFAGLLALACAGVMCAPAVEAGTATATFRVVATLTKPVDTASCRSNLSLGQIECSSISPAGSSQSWKPLVVASQNFNLLFFAPQNTLPGAGQTYSGELGAYSVTRLVTIDGREFLETTVNW